MSEAVLERLNGALEGHDVELSDGVDGTACVRATPANVHAVLTSLRDAGFATNTLVTGIDHHPRSPRFELVHMLMAVPSGDRVRVTTMLEGDEPSAPTCIDLWPGAAYAERECYDMFGIRFDGHEGLKRLLMPEEYGHHPLRKEFPHAGIEPDRLYREWDDARRAAASEEA